MILTGLAGLNYFHQQILISFSGIDDRYLSGVDIEPHPDCLQHIQADLEHPFVHLLFRDSFLFRFDF